MSLDTVIRTSKALYEQKYLQANNQLFRALFRTSDEDTSAAFMLDEFIDAPYAVAYRDKNNQAHIRNYVPGSGTLFEPPIASEKTPVDESLRDAAVEGIESNAGFQSAQIRKIDKIINTHNTAHVMTKNKQAIDVLRTGVFYARGIGASDIGKNENYSRDAANDITADFSAVTIDDALTAINAQLDAQNCPRAQRAVIMGRDWLAELESDSAVLEKMQANTAATILRLNMNPPEWMNTQGLEFVGEYKPAGSSAPLLILTYNPGVQYIPTEGGSSEDWIPSDECVAFSFASPAWRVYRGVDVVENSQIIREVGEVVFDSFISDDPVAEFFRSTTRHMFVYGNINHTLRSTGSNFS